MITSMKKIPVSTWISIALVAFGMIERFVPHLPNATPLTAIAFAGAFYLGPRAAFLPLIVLAISDLSIGWYEWPVMLSVYGSVAAIGLLSIVVRKYRGTLVPWIAVVSSSLLFFAVTNFAVWAASPWYPKTLAGLIYCYEMGLPFLRNMMFGDIAYTAMLFAAFELAYYGVRRFRVQTA